MSQRADDRVFVQVDGEFAGHLPARAEIVGVLESAGASAVRGESSSGGHL